VRRDAEDDRSELYQLTKNGDAGISEDEHFDIIRRKRRICSAAARRSAGCSAR